MDAPLEALLKLNNVNNNLPTEKSFLDLTLFLPERGLKEGELGRNFFKGGAKSKGGT